jgi:hypothetical protein
MHAGKRQVAEFQLSGTIQDNNVKFHKVYIQDGKPIALER